MAAPVHLATCRVTPNPDAQGWSLLLVGPFLDRYMSNAWVSSWDYHTAAVGMLMLSCICAVGVNISQFACLGRFSAVSFQACCQATPPHGVRESVASISK